MRMLPYVLTVLAFFAGDEQNGTVCAVGVRADSGDFATVVDEGGVPQLHAGIGGDE